MKSCNKIMALLLCLLIFILMAAGCSPNNTLPLSTGAEGDEYFIIDRDYVLSAEEREPTAREFERAKDYLEEYILNSMETDKIAFDFVYGENVFSEGLADFESNTEITADTGIQTDYTLTYTKDGYPLKITVYATLYKEYPVCEWTVWLKNISGENTEKISEFYGLKDTWVSEDNEYKVLTFKGSRESTNSFSPTFRAITEDKAITVNGSRGRPSIDHSPYVNVQWNSEDAAWGKEGVFYSVGWSGQWESKLAKTENGIEVNACQQSLNTYLLPDEEIRSPRMTLLFWEKDIIRSQNIWREFVYNCIMPKDNGEPLSTMAQMNTATTTDMMQTATMQNQLDAIQLRVDLGFDFQYWQMDAGWYEMIGDSWVTTGNWQPDPVRFGDTLMPIAEKCHENGIKTILWYEPERVCAYTEFYELREKGYIIENSGWHLYDLSNPEALDYLCEYMVREINENGVDIYRQDFNIDTLKEYWVIKDRTYGADREGISENQYVQGYLYYFDYLLENVSGLIIDNCASGGRRMDLESLSRSVVMWRDDKADDPVLTQCQTYGVNLFNPFTGQLTTASNPTTMKYVTRSNFMQATNFVWDIESGNQLLIDSAKAVVDEYQTYSHYFLCDYYPLTAFSEAADAWMAWQYHDRADNSGIVQVFKRTGSNENEGQYFLSGLDTDTVYIFTDIDTGTSFEALGADVMQMGLKVVISDFYDAKIIHYEAK